MVFKTPPPNPTLFWWRMAFFVFWSNFKSLYLLAQDELENTRGAKMTGMKCFFKKKKHFWQILTFDPHVALIHPGMVWLGVIFWISHKIVNLDGGLPGCVGHQNRAWKEVLGPCGNVLWLVEPLLNFRIFFRGPTFFDFLYDLEKSP